MFAPEEITGANGLALHIVSSDASYKAAILADEINKHHPEHPNNSPELLGLRGRVVRHSRVQIVPIDEHDIYHELCVGPILPVDDEEAFKMVMLHHGDCLSDLVLDLSSIDKPEVRPIKDVDIPKIRVKPEIGNVGPDSDWDTRRRTCEFLARYLINHGPKSSDVWVKKFLRERDEAQRLELVRIILHEAAHLALEPIQPVYEQSRKKLYIPSHEPPKLSTVLFKIFLPEYYQDYVQLLEERFTGEQAA